MFGKTTLLKLIFVFAVLGVLALVAVAPSAARAFFQNDGLSGFTSRLFGDQAGRDREVSRDAAGPSVLGGSITALEGNAASNTGDIVGMDSESTFVEGYFEFTGTVEAINGGLWTVDGFTVVVDTLTELNGTFAVGDTVKVEGTLQDDGSILAREIKAPGTDDMDDPDDDDGNSLLTGQEVEFSGVLSAKVGDTWIVNGVTVIVTGLTELEGKLEIGTMVKVEGTLLENGDVEAREIESELMDGDDMDDDHDADDDSDDDSGDDDTDDDDSDDDSDDDDSDDDESDDDDSGDDDNDDDSGDDDFDSDDDDD